jgi:membrane protease YdiL (CAAX protease family)
MQMPPEVQISAKTETTVRRNPVVTFFALTFLISWTGALAVAAPGILRHQPMSWMTGILTFPVMLLGPFSAGLLLTGIVDGKRGLRALFLQVFRASVPPVWYAALLIPPVLVLSVLVFLQKFVSTVFAPNHFFMGVLFGIPAGFLEEIGWMGYAFRKMLSASNGLAPAILLGLLWSLWHVPVINYLGTAIPHGAAWLPFFLAFTLVMTAMRVLIAWLYVNTKSLLLAQLLHVSSTGALATFSAARVIAIQEAMWYALYGAVLWVIVGIIVLRFSRPLRAGVTDLSGRDQLKSRSM